MTVADLERKAREEVIGPPIPNATVGARYGGQLGDGTTDHAAHVTLAIAF